MPLAEPSGALRPRAGTAFLRTRSARITPACSSRLKQEGSSRRKGASAMAAWSQKRLLASCRARLPSHWQRTHRSSKVSARKR
eukprot:7088230-Pyramimonas_sp.AAC.1